MTVPHPAHWKSFTHAYVVKEVLDADNLLDFLSDKAASSIVAHIAKALVVEGDRVREDYKTPRGKWLSTVIEALDSHPFAVLLSDAWQAEVAQVIGARLKEAEQAAVTLV